tara:strand:+ start:1161 stop:2405 length:1245 start_codon:yes stop_codon:yes gene_type:complete
MSISILTIGDELIIGQVQDTNSSWIAKEINNAGLEVKKIISISDSEKDIINTLNLCLKESNIIIMTGGLGPTHDDLTKKVLCKFFNDSLVKNEKILDHIIQLFKKRNKVPNELNFHQAYLPKKCKIILNKIGTASGMWFEKNDSHVIALPGVPSEMKMMMENYVIKNLKLLFKPINVINKTINTFGLPETNLVEILEEWMDNLDKKVKLAFLPSYNRVRLRLSISGNNNESIKNIIDYHVKKLYKIIPQYIFGEDQTTIEESISKILIKKKLTISLAESCTGGYLSHLFTKISGSSKFFKGSVIAYNNEIKTNFLNVDPIIIQKYGAVSKRVVNQMAVNSKKIFKTDYSISVSGIAGPESDGTDKPVGLIWAAIATPESCLTYKYKFGKNRVSNIQRTANSIFFELLLHLRNSK